MQILLTGASGFLGKIIGQVLKVEDERKLNRSNSDLSTVIPVLPSCDCVIHSAGKAHIVPKTLQEKAEFFNINVKGTLNLIKGLEQSDALPRSFVFISSVSVYGLSRGTSINEGTPLNATDPYGLSKIQAEQVVQEWCTENNVTCSILRLPLLAGPNPPGNLSSMISGIRKGYYFNIAGGLAKKSIVLAEDVAKIIPRVSKIGGIYNLTDGYHPSFSELSELIAGQLGKSKPANIPHLLAKLIAKAGDVLGSKAPVNSDMLRKITSDLTFDDSKAQQMLGWNPTPVLLGFKITDRVL